MNEPTSDYARDAAAKLDQEHAHALDKHKVDAESTATSGRSFTRWMFFASVLAVPLFFRSCDSLDFTECIETVANSPAECRAAMWP